MANSRRKAHCGKKPFKTLIAAQIGLKRTQSSAKKRGDPIVTELSVYKCPYCSAFHVGRSRMKGINWALVEAHDAKLRSLAKA